MGKVGSSTLFSSLQSHFGGTPRTIEEMQNATLYNGHTLNLGMIDGLKRQLPLRRIRKVKSEKLKWIAQNKSALKLITVVRNPIERVISGVFHHWKIYQKMFVGHSPMDAIENYYNSNWSLNWLETHLLEDFGVDVYNIPFDFNKKSAVLVTGNIETLVLRLEDSAYWHKVLGEFLEIDIDEVGHINKSSTASHGYRERLVLSSEFKNRMLNSRLAKHFYTEEERSEFGSRYCKL